MHTQECLVELSSCKLFKEDPVIYRITPNQRDVPSAIIKCFVLSSVMLVLRVRSNNEDGRKAELVNFIGKVRFKIVLRFVCTMH